MTGSLHITDVFEANRVAGGGIFIRTESANSTNAILFFQADVQNDSPRPAWAQIRFTVLDWQRRLVGTVLAAPKQISTGTHFTFTAQSSIAMPRLWRPDHPDLYTLRTELQHDGKGLQTDRTRFGIRTLAYDDKLGFLLNDRSFLIRGAHRHQDYRNGHRQRLACCTGDG